MAGTVIVPLDGSPLSEKALLVGASIAQRIGGKVLLLQVILPPQPIHWGYGGLIPTQEQVELLQAEAESYLAHLGEQVATLEIPVESVVEVGAVGETIVAVAHERQASYIVMSTHGRTGISRWALGSVAGRVLHLTECPLIILPPHEQHSLKSFVLPTLRRIVVPLDGSPFAEQVLPHAKGLARAYDAELLLFRALSTLPPMMPGVEIGYLEPDWYDTLRVDAGAYLERIAGLLREEGFGVRWSLGLEPAANAILEYAENMGADMIAMTSHAREGLSRMVLGSVTDRIVRAGERPVLVTRPATKIPT